MWVNLPIVGICEAVEKGWFWWRKWGARPKDLDQAAMVARKALKKAPILLPVYGHCYMPTSPNRAGNPVFFIHQLEAFNCGFDVAEFFQQELFLLRDHNLPFQLPPLVDSVRPKLDAFGWNWEGSGRDAEIWDKNSDASTRNSDGLGRSSEASSDQEQRVSKSSVSSASSGEHSSWENTDEISEHKFYSSEALSRLSVIPLNESEKVVRRIEFWTDFIAKRQKSRNAAALASRDPAEPLSGAEADEDIDEFSTNIAPKWLGKVLNNISAHLRRGGWKEDDISEIVDASSPRSGGNIQPLDRQSVLEGLVLQLDFLSASLTKAGWSGQDVAETLSFDNQGKSPLKIPPKVAARIAPLASYVANA
ncbi:hypothetical protein O6H91_Y078900 [Diphasiastrum complanatum]|nr:hypothetical protein O6H91_Y078900 [Diphasiastrum complanatum]